MKNFFESIKECWIGTFFDLLHFMALSLMCGYLMYKGAGWFSIFFFAYFYLLGGNQFSYLAEKQIKETKI